MRKKKKYFRFSLIFLKADKILKEIMKNISFNYRQQESVRVFMQITVTNLPFPFTSKYILSSLQVIYV